MAMDELTEARASGTRPKPTLGRRVVSLLFVGALVYGGGSAIAGSCQSQASIRESAERFLAALNRGDVQGAYDQLSRRRRGFMPFETFASLTDHPAFRAHDSEVSFGHLKPHSGGYCTLGSLGVRGAEWAVQLFFIEEEDGWHVHSFGLQAPASIQLGTLLEECGYWEGTRAGYSGPPVERVSPPTPL